MADKAQKKEETKKQLRALLLSAPAALTAQELKRDYHDFMGDPIPFRELGYTTLEDLLKDMPDALRVSWKNGVMCLQPVAQEASVHIQKLVSKQKVNNKNKWATLRRGGPTTRSRGPPQPRSFRSYSNNRWSQSQAPSRYTPPSISAYIRKQITELLKSYPNGLPLTHFDTAFSRRFGVPLSPSGLGFTSMKDLLDSLPDIAKLKEFQGGEWRVAPAYVESKPAQFKSREQIPKYKPPHLSDRKSDSNKGFHRQPEQSGDFRMGSEPIRKYKQTWKTDESQINFQPAGIEEGNFMEDINCQMNQQDFISIPGKENIEKKSLISPVGISVSPPSAPHAPRGRGRRRTGDRNDEGRSQGRDSMSSGGSLEASSAPTSPGAGEFDVSIVREVVQSNIRQILEEKKEGIWAIQLPTEYMKRYGKELSFRDYGYWSLVEMLASLPELMRLERPTDNGDWLCFDARLPVPKKTVVQKRETVPRKQENVSKGRYSSRGEFDSQLEEKIRQVLQCKPRGVLLNEFPSLYKELTGEVLPFKQLGYDKIEFFMIPLADSVVNLEYKGDGCMLVYALDNGKPPRRDLIINPPQDEDNDKAKNIPSDAVGPTVYYKPQELPPLKEYIEIFVSNVVSPGLFWVQVRGKRTTLALDKCMNDLEKLYCSAEGDQYKVPDYLLTVGQMVAAIFPEDNNWHRCVVTALNVDRYVEVYFVDFGNTSVVHRRNIRLIRSKLLKLPAQAIQARLAHLQPREKGWTLNARNRFLNLVTNRPLIALVNFEKDRVLSLVLVDTSTKVDVCLNDLLVTEGYARMEEDNLATNFTGPVGIKEVPDYSHVYGEGFEPKVEVAPPVQSPVQHKVGITEEISRRFVQPIQLTGEYIVNLINLNDTAYLMSTEVSGFLWEADILTGMLEQHNSSVSRLTLGQEEYPEVFEDLCQCVFQDNVKKKFITLYELNRVPFILDLFEHQCEELRTNVKELIQMFDPCDPYWKGEDYPDSETTSQVSEDLSDFQVSLEDIQLSLQLLQFKRKRILQNLMTHPENMEDNVNQLKEVEDQISVLKDMQDQQRQRKALDPDSPEKAVKTSPPGPSGAATSDDKVKATVSEGMFDRSRLSPLKGMSQLAISTPPTTASPIKMNVVAPMQSQNKPAAPSQSQPSTNQELLNSYTLAQQQLLFQTMMMPQAQAQIPSLSNQFVRGTVPFQQSHSASAMDQQYATAQRGSDVNLQYLATSHASMTPQFMSQQFAATSQAAMSPQLMSQQFATTSQTGMTPQMMNLMQANLAGSQFMVGMPPYMGGLPQQTQAQPQANMPLLSGLLPLLQTLNINQNQGSSKDKPS